MTFASLNHVAITISDVEGKIRDCDGRTERLFKPLNRDLCHYS